MPAVKTPTGHDPFEDLPLPYPDEPSAEAPAPPARGRLRAVTADDDDPILRSSTGVMQPCELNALTLLKRAKQYEDIYWDDFLQRIRVGERDFLDGDVIAVQLWLQESTRQARFSRGHTQAAITSMAMERRRDSLIDYVESLKFLDAGTSIDTAFIEAWGAEDTPLTRAASRNFFIALVARALKPGVQVDTLWAFEGPQGCGKSQALRALGGVLHAEVGADIGTTDFMRELRGIWIAELAELESLRGRESSTIKRLLSVPTDRFVEKFEKYAQTYPRRAVATATTNEAVYWQDPTGARRLIPTKCGRIDVDLIEMCAEQWFAEAAERFRAGATWWEWPASIFEAQAERQQLDPWEDVVRDGITHGMGEGVMHQAWPDDFISSSDLAKIWLRLEPQHQGQALSKRIGAIMRKLGFLPQKRDRGTRGWVWGGEEPIEKTFRS